MNKAGAMAALLSISACLIAGGAGGTALGAVGADGPSPAPRPVLARVAGGHGALAYGTSFRLRGRVPAEPSGRVAVEFRRAGKRSWNRLKTVRPSRTGVFRARLTARANGQLRTVSRGVASRRHRLRVKASLKLARPARQANLGRPVVLHGDVDPGKGRRIKLAVKGPRRGTFRTRTDGKGHFVVRWRPHRAGRYRVRAYSARNRLAGSDSGRRFRMTVFRRSYASYYGPGLFGNGTACGRTLTPSTMGVAHRSLPCGKKVTIRHGRRTVRVPVIDRGPYVSGREFDLTWAVKQKLAFGGVGSIWVSP